MDRVRHPSRRECPAGFRVPKTTDSVAASLLSMVKTTGTPVTASVGDPATCAPSAASGSGGCGRPVPYRKLVPVVKQQAGYRCPHLSQSKQCYPHSSVSIPHGDDTGWRAMNRLRDDSVRRESNTAGAKAQWIECDSFRDAEASLPLLKQGARTGFDGRTIGMTEMDFKRISRETPFDWSLRGRRQQRSWCGTVAGKARWWERPHSCGELGLKPSGSSGTFSHPALAAVFPAACKPVPFERPEFSACEPEEPARFLCETNAGARVSCAPASSPGFPVELVGVGEIPCGFPY